MYPIPYIEDIINEFHDASLFSKLDLLSGYWQNPIRDEDIEKTGFSITMGHYHF